MTEQDGLILELESQRNFMATRAAQMAASIAAYKETIKEKDEVIAGLQRQLTNARTPSPVVVDHGASDNPGV